MIEFIVPPAWKNPLELLDSLLEVGDSPAVALKLWLNHKPLFLRSNRDDFLMKTSLTGIQAVYYLFLLVVLAIRELECECICDPGIVD